MQRVRKPRAKGVPMPVAEFEDEEMAINPVQPEPEKPKRQPLVTDAGFMDFEAEKLTDSQKSFLMGLLLWGTQTRACVEAHISPFSVEKWMKESKDFVAARTIVEQCVGDVIEDMAIQRALGGDGKILSKLLSGFKPGRYGRKLEVGGPGGGPIPIQSIADLARRFADGSEDDSGEGEKESAEAPELQ